ncbi:unnamed protein product [Caenorhabditis nigoni]
MSEDPILLSRPFFFVLLGILIHIPISGYYWFLTALLALAGFYLLKLRPQELLRKYLFQHANCPQNRFKWANKRYYAFLCDPKKRSNAHRVNCFCSRSQKYIESPLSATMVALTNYGFEFDETKRGWRNIKLSENLEFQNSYLTYNNVTDRVKVAYFNWNGVQYPAGCSLKLEGHLRQDEQIFLEFGKNLDFWNLLKSIKKTKHRVLDLQESDLQVLYSIGRENSFVTFARNLKTLKIEQFEFDSKRYGFVRIHTDLEFDESKVLKKGKRILLFMTYGESEEATLETLTVYRTESGGLEKKILKDGRFELIGEKQILECI